MGSFFDMGGHAVFIWSAYGATALILIGLLVASWRGLRVRETELKLAESATQARRAARTRT